VWYFGFVLSEVLQVDCFFGVETEATHKDSNLVTVEGGRIIFTKDLRNVKMHVNSKSQEVHPKLEMKFKYLVYLTA